MRQGQHKNRSRGRGGRRQGNALNRVFESNGPDVKVRGTAQHVAEKYLQLARDAQSSGDTVAAESYFQHAEHYYRILLAAQEQMAQQFGHSFPPNRAFVEDADEGDEEGDEEAQPFQPGTGPQPDFRSANGHGGANGYNGHGGQRAEGEGGEGQIGPLPGEEGDGSRHRFLLLSLRHSGGDARRGGPHERIVPSLAMEARAAGRAAGRGQLGIALALRCDTGMPGRSEGDARRLG